MATSRRWIRFRIRSLLVVTLLVCLALWVAPWVHYWYTSVPLSQEVAAFNMRVTDDSIGKHEPPVTEAEIVRAIKDQLPTLDASPQVKAIYLRIARTGRLPESARLDEIPAYGLRNGKTYSVWWINLNVMTGEKSGYGLRIRENDNPVSKANGPPYASVDSASP